MKEESRCRADGAQLSPPAGSNSRLPCRGCASDCVHYTICDGRPWRTLTREHGPGGNLLKVERGLIEAQITRQSGLQAGQDE